MRDAFVKRDEQHAAWLSEMEFAEMARVLKMLAQELGIDRQPAVELLASKGLEAALGALASVARINVTEAYYRHRALWRAGQCGFGPIH